ncbi:MAG: HAMP domain-containing protein [Lentisphaerae bacterium]|nr:MAG: HAMP domain-containing protein [Lentisphaerota bacterium]
MMKKMGFRGRTILWFWGIVFSLLTGMLLAMFLLSINTMRSIVRGLFKGMARNIVLQLESTDNRRLTPAQIDHLFALTNDSGNFSFAVFDREGKLLHHSPAFPRQWLTKSRVATPGKLRLLLVKSGRHWHDYLSEWCFLYPYRSSQHIVLIYGIFRFELFERLLEGLGVVCLLSVIIALPASYHFSRRTLRQIERIRQTAESIQQGNYSQRIPLSDKTNNDLRLLVTNLNQTFSALENAIVVHRRFSSDVAHELRTPLTCLIGNLEVTLKKDRSVEEYRDVLNSCLEDARNLALLVERILFLNKPIDSSKFRDVRLDKLVDDVLDSLSSFPLFHNHTVDFHRPEEPVAITGDSILLQQMCTNLIENALKYSPPNTKVSIEVSTQKDNAVFMVKDEGIGIAPEDQKHIFDRFFQVDPSRSSGSGLGLSLVKSVVEAHGGSIAVESAIGRGSVFTVILPRSRSAATQH